MNPRFGLVFIVTLALGACAPATSPQTRDGATNTSSSSTRTTARTIGIGLDEETKSFWDSITGGGGTGARELANIFNQYLVAIRQDGSPTPRLLTELPSIDRGTWWLLPGGRMETDYKLRSDVLWHDGAPFTAEDIAFSLQVNKDPEVPNGNQDAVRLVESWRVTDPNTIVVTWRESYAWPDRMEHRDLFTLPKHLLEQPYTTGGKESFLALPYWNAEYVGVGPFRANRWEPGSAIDFAAFDKYFLGRPRLDGIRVQFITDKGAMLGNLSAKSLQMMVTLGSIPEFTAMNGLKRDWEASGYGTVLMDPISYRFIEPQKFHNPTPADLTDPRVRRALLLAVDRPELARLAFADDGVVANSWVHPTFPYYPQVQDVIVSYPYDTRQASQLLADAGWRPGSDGTLEKGGQRFSMTMRDIDGERDSDIIASMWKQIGVVGSYELKTAAAIRDREDRATFTGIDLTSNPMGVAAVVRRTATSNLPTAENRWVGTNRGGYANPAWDALEPKLLGAIDDRDRIGVERDLLSILAADLPVMPLYFRFDMVPVGGGLKGPVANTGVAHRGFILHTWNVHEWDLP